MVKIEGLKLAPGQEEALLRGKAARLLRVPEGEILSLQVLRRSVDAREELRLVYTAAVELRQEKAVLRRVRDKRVTPYAPETYRLPEVLRAPETPPVVIGAGPGGLFAALVLARCGLRPIILERGRDAVTRQRDVEAFWRGGPLNTESNVQFGEGGAGAFSDGKLNTGTRDRRHRWILEQLVACGAPESILTDAKPHVGTDMLHVTLVNLRRQLLSLGAQVRFGHRVTGLRVRDGALEGLEVRSPEGPYVLPARHAVLALGHSARDTFEMLHAAGVRMEQKPFAVGVRIEHRQSDMDAAQYRQFAGHPCLPAASYKLSCHLENGRSAFSFCVCPGGQVVAATSEQGRVVTNGMSAYARDRENINGGLLVNVTPEDFGSGHPLAGVAFQRQLEEAARPERQSQPQQAPRHRTAARPRQRVSPLALCAVGALAAMAVVLVMGYIQLTAVTGSISDLQEQVSQLEDQRVSLVMDYERTFDRAKLKEAAEAAGMKKPTAGQVEYVELGGGSKAEVYQAESDSLLSQLTHSVKNGVGARVEYFR